MCVIKYFCAGMWQNRRWSKSLADEVGHNRSLRVSKKKFVFKKIGSVKGDIGIWNRSDSMTFRKRMEDKKASCNKAEILLWTYNWCVSQCNYSWHASDLKGQKRTKLKKALNVNTKCLVFKNIENWCILFFNLKDNATVFFYIPKLTTAFSTVCLCTDSIPLFKININFLGI